MRKILIAVCLAFCFSCTNEGGALKTLEDAGFTNVELTGYDWLTCGDSDETCTGFRALNPTGTRWVEGAVGCNLMGCGKGCTIRFN